jgi:predicted phosphodiesterase
MRLATISDIHGNFVALEAVLASIEAQEIEDIICLGDVAATGPQPQQVIERLRSINCPVVMGNTDTWLLEPQLKETVDPFAQRIQDIGVWGAQQLSAADKEYLRTFQPTIEYPLTRGKKLLGYHGSPRSFHDPILPTTPEEELGKMFEGYEADILVGGHTHTQMFRRYKDALILNPGSVGIAMDRIWPPDEIRNPPWAEYAVVHSKGNALSIELHRVPFDVQAFIQAILTSGMPHAEWLANDWNLV